MSKRKYTKEFKLDACKLAIGSKKSKAEIARDLGIKENVLYNWVKKYNENGPTCFENGFNVSEEESELSQLRAELAEMKMERDILKKALTIFSKK